VTGSAAIAQDAVSNGVLPSAQRRFSTPRALVMPGLDTGIHRLAKKLDCRVKPGNDGQYS
jgi:hypothetical protein